MAFSKGQETVETPVFKKYIGVAPVSILAINPTQKELEKIYGTQVKEVNYLSEVDSKDKSSKVKQVRIDFIVQTDKESCGVEIKNKISFFINDELMYNKDKTKVQVIDKYSRTAWVTVEDAKEHKIPVYSNGPAKIDSDYRPLYIGEENLVKFIRVFLGINDKDYFDKNANVWKSREGDDASLCEGILEHVKDYFSGNVSEIKEYIGYQPNNKIEVLFGIKNSNGAQYQTIYNNQFVRYYKSTNDNKYNNLKKNLEERKAAGAYSTTDFEVCPLKEYVVTPTDFNKEKSSTDDVFPFNNDDEMPF